MQGAVSLWAHSGTYNHCFLILPIFIYIVWSSRAELAAFAPQPFLWGGGVIVVFAGLWLTCFLAGIAEGAQFAIIGIVQGVLLTLFGRRVFLRLLFPFCYLWLLVPSGEFMVPTLQLVTAKAAAWLLDMAGIATFQDGIGIEVPSGAYMVAPGCAGLNFVLAGLATAAPFAELIYRGWRRRVAFVAAVLALAVAGNAVRVFLIIAIAHVTNNVGDIADDHLLFGWAFFSLLLLGAMALGQRFRQDHAPSPAAPPAAAAVPSASIVTAAAFSAVLVVAAPVAAWLAWPDVATAAIALPPLSCRSLDADAARPGWPAGIAQVDGLEAIDCRRDGRHVHFAVAVLDRPVRQGKLFGVEHRIAAGEGWNRWERRATTLQIGGGRSVPVQADLEIRGGRRRLVWSLFRVGGLWRTPGLAAMLADVKADISGRRRAVVVVAVTEADEGEPPADSVLRSFLASQPLDRLAAAEGGH